MSLRVLLVILSLLGAASVPTPSRQLPQEFVETSTMWTNDSLPVLTGPNLQKRLLFDLANESMFT